MRLQLTHLAHRHLVGDLGDHAERVQIAELHQFDDRAGIQVVPHDDGDLVAERGIEGGLAAAQHRVVDSVVVNQGRQMNQLNGRGERDLAVVQPFHRPGGKQQQRGAEQLATDPQQMGVGIADERKVRPDDADQSVEHLVQLVPHRILQSRQAPWHDVGCHAIARHRRAASPDRSRPGS